MSEIPPSTRPSSPAAASAWPTRRLRGRGLPWSVAATSAADGRAAGSGSVIAYSSAARSRGSRGGTTGLRYSRAVADSTIAPGYSRRPVRASMSTSPSA